jgi:hypothetical protein
VQDRSLHFLFENKGSMYDGKDFEMLAALNQHCHPNSVANAFTTLLSLFNNSMGASEEIMDFCSQFDGMVNDILFQNHSSFNINCDVLPPLSPLSLR